MIEQMKKVDILLYHREQEEFLSALGEAGLLHVQTEAEELSPKANNLRTKLLSLDRTIMALKKVSASNSRSNLNAEQAHERVQEILTRKEAIAAEEAVLRKEISQLQPWGDFSLETIKKLHSKGIDLRFYEVSHKQFHKLEQFTHEVVAEGGGKSFVVVIKREGEDIAEEFEQIVLPNRSLSECNLLKEALHKEKVELDDELAKIASQIDEICSFRAGLVEDIALENARTAMVGTTAGSIFHLSGWLPAEKEARISETLNRFSCWYEFREPKEGDTIPVKLKNKAPAKLFEPITKIFDLPDYFELDPTPFFAPFYALFFGLCLADIGYGILLLILALVGIAKGPKELKPIMILGMVLGGTTIIGGLLLDTFFGANHGGAAAILRPVEVGGATLYPAMAFSVYLGIVQILLGMSLKAVNGFRRGGFVQILYPIGKMLLALTVAFSLVRINFLDMATFFEIVTGGAVSATDISSWSGWENIVPVTLAAGLFLLFFFNNPEKKLGARLPLGLWELYQFVTGIMGDGLSYIRLFALGLAGGLLGNAFNQIAFMMTGDGQPAWMIVFTILILILGHSINFVLAALGSFVHPLRLTFVEFYNNLSFTGGAPAYLPFVKNSTTTN